MSDVIKNEQLRYCVERLNSMNPVADADLIFQGQCLSALWDKIFKLQPELETPERYNRDIPLFPYLKDNYFECSNCGESLGGRYRTSEPNYCERCGQKQNWIFSIDNDTMII